MAIKLPCIKCELTDNSNGLYTCNGCRQRFCSNHVTDHSNELRNRFEQTMNEYNLINEIFQDYKQNSNDFPMNINNREKEMNEIKLHIVDNQKRSSYSEKDLDEWMRKLDKLKTKLTKTNEANSCIDWLRYFKPVCLLVLTVCLSTYCGSCVPKLNQYSVNIEFTDVNGPIQLLENKNVAEHNGSDGEGSFRINKIYSEGIHSVRLSLEKSSLSKTFIGIINKQSISSSYGWFIGDKQVIPHKPGDIHIFQIVEKFWSLFASNQSVKQDDIVEIEIDCINFKIALKNERTSEKFELGIDSGQSSLPWQIIINLERHGDRVRLQQ